MSYTDTFSKKTLVKKFINAVEEGIIDLDIYWLEQFYNFPTKTLNKYLKDNNLKYDEFTNTIVNIYPEDYARLIYYNNEPYHNIFGCNLSSDTDIIVMVDKISYLHPKDIKILTNYLEKKYKNIDVNLISINNGTIQTLHGGNEIINMVLETYKLHDNTHPCFFKEHDRVEILPLIKISTLSKFIIDNGKKMFTLDEYKIVRQNKKDVYQNGIDRLYLALKWIKKFSLKSVTDSNIGFWKSTFMKICQSLLSDKNITNGIYTKESLANIFISEFTQFNECIKDILLKTHRGIIPLGIIDQLIILVKELGEKVYPKYSNPVIINPIVNKTNLTDKIYYEFINSPINPSNIFISEWIKNYDIFIEKQFIEENKNITYLKNFNELYDRIINVPQHSPEWKKLYSDTYVCGRNSGHKKLSPKCSKEDSIKLRYNLISGCIGENLVDNFFDFNNILNSNFIKIKVGMIVDNIAPGSNGSCPDLLLLDIHTKKIIIVEIKTFQHKASYNSNFLREAILARKQIAKAANIINIYNNIVNKGIIIYLFITPDEHKNYNKYIYDCRYEIININ